MRDKDTYINALIISAIIGVIGVTAMTIGGELYPPFKNSLKDIFSHHWIGKGVISFIGFLVIGVILSWVAFLGRLGIRSLLLLLTWISVLSTLLLLAFFVFEFFSHL